MRGKPSAKTDAAAAKTKAPAAKTKAPQAKPATKPKAKPKSAAKPKVTTRRARSDSVSAAVDVAKRAQQAIEPPSNVPLGKEDMSFFASVIDEFARSEWTAHQLELAAIMARKMRLLRDELETLEKEGFVLETAQGTPCQNPRLGGVRMLDTSIMATRRSLSLHARAKTGEARDVGKKRAIALGIEEGIADDGGGLLN